MTTPASIVNPTSSGTGTPFISPLMFKQSRRGVQVDNLVPKGTAVENEQALYQYLQQGCAWCEEIVNQPLVAGLDTVQTRLNVSRDGFATVFPRYRPVIGLTSFSCGATPQLLTPLSNLGGVGFLENSGMSIPISGNGLSWSSQGPLQFGGLPAPSFQAWAEYTYAYAWPATSLTAPVSVGDTSISVAETAGIIEGRTQLQIFGTGPVPIRFTAGAVSTADSGGLGSGPGTVGCSMMTQAVALTDPYPLIVSAMPASLIDAGILATRAVIKQAGAGNVAMTSATSRSAKSSRNPSGAGDDFAEAEKILLYYIPLRS